MKIAHINNIANVAWRLAEAQRRLGHEAVVFSLRDSPYRFPRDVRIGGADGPLGWNAVTFARWRTFSDFDVIHVHGGIWKSQIFFPLFKRRFSWKTLAVHYHGSETRTGRGLHHLRSIDLRFHSTPDLAQWLPGSVWVPNPIDLPDLPPEPNNARPTFGHIVSSPVQKGTEAVKALFQKAFGPVRTEEQGPTARYSSAAADLLIASQVPHDEALRIIASCDAVIDQISPYMAYGMVAIEAMALGKPVFGTLRLDWYPGCPVIPAQTEDASDKLRAIAEDGKYRRERGRAGRDYVAHVHESGRVARQVLKAYYSAQQQPPLKVSEATAYWKRRGASYATEFGPKALQRSTAQAAELLDILGALSFRSVGEIGCGFGRLGSQLTESWGARWTGADLSRGQLVEARERDERIRPFLVEASAEALPFTGGAFDLVLAVEMLMHIPPERIGSVLKELWRVARLYVVHLDWFEDYLVDHGTGWCWVHDYPRLWEALGATATEVRLRSTRIQSAFVVSKPLILADAD